MMSEEKTLGQVNYEAWEEAGGTSPFSDPLEYHELPAFDRGAFDAGAAAVAAHVVNPTAEDYDRAAGEIARRDQLARNLSLGKRLAIALDALGDIRGAGSVAHTKAQAALDRIAALSPSLDELLRADDDVIPPWDELTEADRAVVLERGKAAFTAAPDPADLLRKRFFHLASEIENDADQQHGGYCDGLRDAAARVRKALDTDDSAELEA